MTSDARNLIAAYARVQSPELRAICDKLQVEIDKTLPRATSKIWHGSPVWWIGENPVVGYNVRQMRVDLMFWSGQLFDDSRLKPLGKDKAAQVSFQDESDINLPELRRWLRKPAPSYSTTLGCTGKSEGLQAPSPESALNHSFDRLLLERTLHSGTGLPTRVEHRFSGAVPSTQIVRFFLRRALADVVRPAGAPGKLPLLAWVFGVSYIGYAHRRAALSSWLLFARDSA